MDYQNGDIVRVKTTFLGSKPNSKGFIYDTYEDFDDPSKRGVSIILEDGLELGGFSYGEQQEYLEFVKKSGMNYKFRNVMQVSWDYDSGVFKFD